MSRALLTREVSIAEAKAQFDTLIAEVARSDNEVAITDGHRVIARLVPPADAEAARERFFTRVDVLRERFANVSSRELERLADAAVDDARRRLNSGQNA